MGRCKHEAAPLDVRGQIASSDQPWELAGLIEARACACVRACVCYEFSEVPFKREASLFGEGHRFRHRTQVPLWPVMCNVTLTPETSHEQTPKSTFYPPADKAGGPAHVEEHAADSLLINGNIWVAPLCEYQ